MDFAIITVPAAPVRRKPLHRMEMTNQLLFGESIKILKLKGELWVKIQSLHDGYEGWITNSMYTMVAPEIAKARNLYVAADMLQPITFGKQKLFIPAGSSLPFFENGKGRIGSHIWQYEGSYYKLGALIPSSEVVKKLTEPWLNAPYCWGGRIILGVDCSGFAQVIFKLMGIDLPRDAWQQAQVGKPVKKFKNSQPGDLVFFNNKEEIVHVGILLSADTLIHSSGKVRIDKIDRKGIINAETGKRTLSLRAIRRFW